MPERLGGDPGRRCAPTIVDVAERAGVSRSLVSLVLRDSPLVREERRQRVLRAIEELGYRPNDAARRLARRRTDLVGTLVSDLRNPFFAELAECIDDEVARSGYRTVIASGHREAARESVVLSDFLESRVEAVVLLSPALTSRSIAAVAETVPVVVEGRPDLGASRVDLVSTDDAAGAALAVEHLVALGHERIAHVTGIASGARARRHGYEEAMRATGLERYAEVVGTEEKDQGGYPAARQLFQRVQSPTAVFAVSDVVALGALAAADDAGLRVPADISVVGFDDTYIAALRGVGLTSVAQPTARLAEEIAAVLVQRADGPASRRRRRRRFLTPSLTVRATTAAPRG